MRQLAGSCVLLLCFAAGCNGPNKANIALRKENQDLREKVVVLTRQHEADVASLIAATQPSTGAAPVAPARLERAFTAAGVKIDKLTGWRGDQFKVYVTPIDAAGDTLKAAGAVTVELFDLAKADKPLIGTWQFPESDAARNWYDSMIVKGYALSFIVSPPMDPSEITVRVTFKDALTDRTLTAQRVIPIPATALAPK